MGPMSKPLKENIKNSRPLGHDSLPSQISGRPENLNTQTPIQFNKLVEFLQEELDSGLPQKSTWETGCRVRPRQSCAQSPMRNRQAAAAGPSREHEETSFDLILKKVNKAGCSTWREEHGQEPNDMKLLACRDQREEMSASGN